MNIKKVLVVTTVQITVEAFLIPHIKSLEKKGYEVWIATNTNEIIPEELKKNKWINISFSRNPFCKDSFKAIKEMRDLLRNNKFEMIQFHTPVAAFLGRYAAMKEKQKNIIYIAHGFHFFKGAPLKNWILYCFMEKLAMNWTDKIIVMNEEDYKRAKKLSGDRTKVYKIDGIGLDLEKYKNGNGERIKKEIKIQSNEFVITIIGELNKNKNHIQLINAVSLLKNEGFENIRIIFVGIGIEEKKLRDKAKKNKIKIDFLGFRSDIKDIIAVSDIICSMSYREGLPRNIMEGMAQGKPIIATNIRGNKDIIKNEKNGYLVPVNNYKETANKIKRLMLDEKILDQILINNVENVKKFEIKKIIRDMENIYFEKME